jgi:hypothetical protein
LVSSIDVAEVGRDELASTVMDTVEFILLDVVMLETFVETKRTDMVTVDFVVHDDVVGWVIDEVDRTLDTVVTDVLDVVDDTLEIVDDDHLDEVDVALDTVVDTAFTVAEIDVQPGCLVTVIPEMYVGRSARVRRALKLMRTILNYSTRL